MRNSIDFLSLQDELSPTIRAGAVMAIVQMLRMAENYSRSMGLSACNFCQGKRKMDAGYFDYEHGEHCPIEVLSV